MMHHEKRQTSVRGTTRLKVLVVDDQRDLADVAGALLSAYAIPNRVVYSAEEGLRVFAEDQEINAVFSDIMMPEKTGLQLAMALREHYPEVKIVLTSGFTPPDILAAHQHLYVFTPKPYEIETVIKLLGHAFILQPLCAV